MDPVQWSNVKRDIVAESQRKELIRKKLPKYAEKFEEWESKFQNPYEVEEKDGLFIQV